MIEDEKVENFSFVSPPKTQSLRAVRQSVRQKSDRVGLSGLMNSGVCMNESKGREKGTLGEKSADFGLVGQAWRSQLRKQRGRER